MQIGPLNGAINHGLRQGSHELLSSQQDVLVEQGTDFFRTLDRGTPVQVAQTIEVNAPAPDSLWLAGNIMLWIEQGLDTTSGGRLSGQRGAVERFPQKAGLTQINAGWCLLKSGRQLLCRDMRHDLREQAQIDALMFERKQ